MSKEGLQRVWKRRVSRVGLAVFVVGLISLFTSVVQAGTISEGYQTDDTTIGVGTAVALQTTDSEDKIIPATIGNAENFVGIVTTVDENLISLRNQSSDVLVTTAGEVNAYVSDVDGSVAAGDAVAVSPLRGILSGAQNATETGIVGVALEDFPTENLEERTVSTQSGNQKTVTIAKMRIQLGRDFASKEVAEQQKSFLVIAGESVTGQSVGQAQVIAALIVLLIVMIVEGSIIYGAIHSTIGALGRNPLSKRAVFKQLLQVSWLALLVLIFGFGAIFIILWI